MSLKSDAIRKVLAGVAIGAAGAPIARYLYAKHQDKEFTEKDVLKSMVGGGAIGGGVASTFIAIPALMEAVEKTRKTLSETQQVLGDALGKAEESIEELQIQQNPGVLMRPYIKELEEDIPEALKGVWT
jgi:hypothetical protein